MRQQTGFFEREPRHRREIFEGPLEALSAEKFARFGERNLGLIAEAEKQFMASGTPCGFGSGDHVFGRHIAPTRLAGIATERAIAATVAAERRERNERLAGVTDRASLDAIPQRGCCFEERGGLRVLDQ